MSRTPSVSVIIPVKPGRDICATECLKWLDYPGDRIEVIVSEGTSPSRQRNEAASRAKGEILYFLDDDSCVLPDTLKNIIRHFEDKQVAAVGGPSITPESDSVAQKTFGAVLSSFFGGFSIRNRYRKTGAARVSSENELILCNLAIRKDRFLAEGGLNEKLYPNEENELLNRFEKNGYLLMHDPDAYILRSQRKNFSAFTRQMLNYGRGRAEQTFIAPESFNPFHLIPSFFLFYILSIVFYNSFLYSIPLLCYLVLNLSYSLRAAYEQRDWRLSFLLPASFFIMHICYGAGILWGVFRRLSGASNGNSEPVNIRMIKQLYMSIW